MAWSFEVIEDGMDEAVEDKAEPWVGVCFVSNKTTKSVNNQVSHRISTFQKFVTKSCFSRRKVLSAACLSKATEHARLQGRRGTIKTTTIILQIGLKRMDGGIKYLRCCVVGEASHDWCWFGAYVMG